MRVGAGRVKRLSPSIYLCVCVCVSAKNTAVCCLTARKSPRNSSLPLGLAIHILSKDAYKVGRVFCRVLWPWFLIAARPRGGIEHYGNWVCQPTTSLRERCEQTHEVGENVSKQCRSARPVRHESYVAEQRAVQYQHNLPTTCSYRKATDCYKSYKAPSSIRPVLLWKK